jgi:transposase
MTNVLKVSHQTTIYSLTDRGWSRRRIARELGIDRETVGRYLQLRAKPAISIPGSEPAVSAEPAISIPGKTAGRQSHCEPLTGVIQAKIELGLSAQRIYQDLVQEHGFTDSYQSVQRFVRALKQREPERVWRIECAPGEEAQIDFGLGATLYDSPQSKGRRTWVFRVILSYSRKGYCEAVTRQDTETFLRCLENALRSFGGVPLMLNVDNLKAAVLKADWFDPEINPKLADFCRHYGTHVVPCRPFTPQHKGKVERGVAYVRSNALKGRRFGSLSEENLHLAHWESATADKRIHGTTRKQVGALFEEERAHLLPLPASLFPCYQEARRSVHRDSYVEVERAYYEAPPELIGRQVWVRWDSRCVRILNERAEQVAMHTRIEAGKFSRVLGARGQSAPVQASCRYWVSRAAVLGDQCGQWAQAAIDARGPEALRSLMALCGLIQKHSALALNASCAKALKTGTHRLKDLKRILGNGPEQSHFGFAQSHPLIRDLSTYSDFLHQHTTHPHKSTSP